MLGLSLLMMIQNSTHLAETKKSIPKIRNQTSCMVAGACIALIRQSGETFVSDSLGQPYSGEIALPHPS
jgi:hypothetical protein